MLIMIDGKIEVKGTDDFRIELLAGDVFSGVEISSEISGDMHGEVVEDCRIFQIDRGKLFDLISRREQLARRLIRNKEKRLISQIVDA